MRVRRLTVADAQAGHALRLRALSESGEAFGTTYEEYATWPLEQAYARYALTGDDFTLGAFEEDRLVGVVTFRREQRIKTRHKGSVTGMFVAQEARGKGVGRALMAALIDEARGIEGLEQMNLDVFTASTAARQLYLSLGFEVCGLERHADKVGDAYYDSELMVYFLHSRSHPDEFSVPSQYSDPS